MRPVLVGIAVVAILSFATYAVVDGAAALITRAVRRRCRSYWT